LLEFAAIRLTTIGFLDFKSKEEAFAATENIAYSRLLKRASPYLAPVSTDFAFE